MERFEFTHKTERLMSYLDDIVWYLQDEDLNDEEADKLNDSIGAIRSAIYDLQQAELERDIFESKFKSEQSYSKHLEGMLIKAMDVAWNYAHELDHNKSLKDIEIEVGFGERVELSDD